MQCFIQVLRLHGNTPYVQMLWNEYENHALATYHAHSYLVHVSAMRKKSIRNKLKTIETLHQCQYATTLTCKQYTSNMQYFFKLVFIFKNVNNYAGYLAMYAQCSYCRT